MEKDNDKSVFIIKPEAFSQREKIKRIITTQSNLEIVATKIVVLTEQDIDTLYLDDIGTDLMKAIKVHLIGKTVEVGVVAGKDVITELTRVCGKYPFPGDCSKDTIRGIFGKNQPAIYHGIVYYLNAIHKASEKEAKPSLEWFYSKK